MTTTATTLASVSEVRSGNVHGAADVAPVSTHSSIPADAAGASEVFYLVPIKRSWVYIYSITHLNEAIIK